MGLEAASIPGPLPMADDLACWISDRPGRFAEGACVPAATDASHPSETLVCAIVGRIERIYEAFGKIGVLDAIAGHRPAGPTSWSNRPIPHRVLAATGTLVYTTYIAVHMTLHPTEESHPCPLPISATAADVSSSPYSTQ